MQQYKVSTHTILQDNQTEHRVKVSVKLFPQFFEHPSVQIAMSTGTKPKSRASFKMNFCVTIISLFDLTTIVSRRDSYPQCKADNDDWGYYDDWGIASRF